MLTWRRPVLRSLLSMLVLSTARSTDNLYALDDLKSLCALVFYILNLAFITKIEDMLLFVVSFISSVCSSLHLPFVLS